MRAGGGGCHYWGRRRGSERSDQTAPKWQGGQRYPRERTTARIPSFRLRSDTARRPALQSPDPRLGWQDSASGRDIPNRSAFSAPDQQFAPPNFSSSTDTLSRSRQPTLELRRSSRVARITP